MAMCRVACILVALACLVFPHAASPQSSTLGSIAGSVRDSTGAVLPGVSVEVSSPALIEQVRSVTTDQQGNYKIVDLRPGVYTVRFSLAGFSGVRREGIELTTGFTATVSAELSVGSVEETITVSGATPVVDTQNVQTQSVFSRETLDALPTLKSLQSYAALTLGASFANAADQDVGGSRGEFPGSGGFIVHNSRANDNRMTMDGMPFSSLIGEIAASNKGQFINQLTVEETAIQTGGGSAEYQTGGVYMNIVPKSGGNTFATTVALNGTGSDLQSSNLTDELRARGVATSPKVKQVYDAGGALGGPIKRNRLWFFTAHRWWGTQNTVPGSYYSASQHTLFYVPDLSRPAFTDLPHRDSSLRLTWQASTKNKITVSESVQKATMFWQIDQPFRAPEAAIHQQYPNSITQLMWSYPATNKLLFEAGATILRAEQNNFRMAGVLPDDIPVTELSTGLNYNARAAIPAMNTTDAGVGQRRDQSNQRFSMTYVTGSHAVKVGMYAMEGWGFNHTEVNETRYGPIRLFVSLGCAGRHLAVGLSLRCDLSPHAGLGPVRSGPVDRPAADAQRGAALRPRPPVRPSTAAAGERLRGRSGLPAARRYAELQRCLATARRRLRPVRHREDSGQSVSWQVRGRRGRRVGTGECTSRTYRNRGHAYRGPTATPTTCRSAT